MGWRKTQSDVQSGRVSFAKPKDNFRGFANAANIIAKSWMQDAADEKEAEKLRLKEEKANRKRIRNAQAAAEVKAKKEKQAVSSIINRAGLDPSLVTPSVRQQILSDVQLMGVSDAISDYGVREIDSTYAYGNVSTPIVTDKTPEALESLDTTASPAVDGTSETGDAASLQTDALLKEGDLVETDVPITEGLLKQDMPSNGVVPTLFVRKEPTIDWGSITTEAEANEIAKDNEKKHPALAARIRKFGQGLNLPLTYADVESMGTTARAAALADANYSADNKTIITNWNTENTRILAETARIVPYADITVENYEQMAAGFDSRKLKDQATSIRALGNLLVKAKEKPLTLPEIDGLSLELLEAAVATSTMDTAQTTLFQQVINSKYKTLGRGLSDYNDIKLQSVRDNTAFSTPTEIEMATAILNGRKSEFDIKDWDTVKGPTLDVAIDNSVKDSTMNVQLIALRKARENTPEGIELDMSGGFLMTVYEKPGEEGGDPIKVIATTALTTDGRMFDIDRQIIIPANSTVTSKSIKTIQAKAGIVAQMDDKVLTPLTDSRREMAYMLTSADKLESFLDPDRGGSPEILTAVGGDLSRIISRLDNEYSALNKLFLSGASEDEVFTYINTTTGNLKDTASKSSQFQSELLKFAYLYATVSLEQRGAGLSNTDFKNALQIVGTGSDYPTFSNNLRTRSLEGIGKVDGRISDIVNTSAQVKLLDELDPSGNLTSGYKISTTEYLEGRGLGHMVEYANSTVSGKATPPPKPVAPEVTIGSKISLFREDPNLQSYIKAYNLNADDIVIQNKYLELISKQNGIPIEALKRVLEGE